jgi:hypothetical protein
LDFLLICSAFLNALEFLPFIDTVLWDVEILLHLVVHRQSAGRPSPDEIVSWIPENLSAVTSCEGDGIQLDGPD